MCLNIKKHEAKCFKLNFGVCQPLVESLSILLQNKNVGAGVGKSCVASEIGDNQYAEVLVHLLEKAWDIRIPYLI